MSNREPGWYWTRWIVDGPWVPVRWYCSPDEEEMWIARSVGEYPIEVGPRIQPPGEPGKQPLAASDLLSDLVTRFSAALLDKLRAAEEKYGWENGWTETGWEADCQQALLKHLAKGDPRDVAAYCAFLWHHGSPTVAAVPAASDLRERAMVLITKLQGGEPCDPNDDDIEPIVAAFAAIRAEASAEGGVISLDAIDGPSPTEQESHHSERLQRRNSKP